MQEYREYYGRDGERPSSLGFAPVVRAIMIANVAAFFLTVVIRTAFPDFLHHVGLVPPKAIGEGHLWQFFTYAFFHSPWDPLHLIFNMIGLYFFGREVEILYGRRKFLMIYFGAVVAGGLIACIPYEPYPVIGASAAVYSIMVVYALHFPRQKVLFFFILPLEIWLVVALLIGFDIAFYVTTQTDKVASGVAHLAHLGGVAYGFLFWRLRAPIEAYLERVEGRIAEREVAQEEELEARLDSVLEKINKEGMGALSKKEWEVLKKASKHYQRKP